MLIFEPPLGVPFWPLFGPFWPFLGYGKSPGFSPKMGVFWHHSKKGLKTPYFIPSKRGQKGAFLGPFLTLYRNYIQCYNQLLGPFSIVLLKIGPKMTPFLMHFFKVVYPVTPAVREKLFYGFSLFTVFIGFYKSSK